VLGRAEADAATNSEAATAAMTATVAVVMKPRRALMAASRFFSGIQQLLVRER